MIDQTNIDRLHDAVVYAQGEKVGSVDQVFLDDNSGQPKWVTVSTGLFGMKTSFVPVDDASFDGERLEVSTTKDIIKDAPRIDEDQHLSPAEERDLYAYYERSTHYEELERRGYDVDADEQRDRDRDRIDEREDRREEIREERDDRREELRDARRDAGVGDEGRAYLRSYRVGDGRVDRSARDGGLDPDIEPRR